MVSVSINEIRNRLPVGCGNESYCYLSFSLSSEHVFLLSHISRASSLLKDDDIDRIEPLLVTFCSLYSMSLVPLHDDEFFHGPPATAFRTEEISDMVRALRDVCMGIVQFMYPDKQISNPLNSATSHVNDEHDEKSESMPKGHRIHKQVQVARQRASRFSLVFKVNFDCCSNEEMTEDRI